MQADEWRLSEMLMRLRHEDRHHARLQVEPILRNMCRHKGCPMPDIPDEELDELGTRPDRMAIFRFVVRKLRDA